jgi:predicted RNA binding protein YcfA (HicA-like mRNA interferase family)/uncharacterized protein YlxP (DUF503 family)
MSKNNYKYINISSLEKKGQLAPAFLSFCFKQSAKRLFLSDAYSLVQQIIGFVNPRHASLRKKSTEQLMINFKGLQQLISHQGGEINSIAPPIFIDFEKEVQADLDHFVKKMMCTLNEDFTDKLSKIIYHYGEAFHDESMWLLIPLLEENQEVLNAFYSDLEVLKELQQKYCLRLKEIQSQDAFSQAKKIIGYTSRYLQHFVLFIKDIEALLGKFTEEELEQETYLLPKELIEFLDLEGFESSLVTSTSSEDEEEAAPQEALPVMKEKETQEEGKLPSPRYQKDSIKKEYTPKKGEKLRKYFKRLKEVKEYLGLNRVTGSHKQFKGRNGAVVTIPDHGGGTILKRGTAKSVGEQMVKIFQGQK